MSFRAFNPTGPTIKLVAATTAPTGLQAIGAPPANQYRIHNAGTTTAFIAFGTSAGSAQTNAVTPTGAGASSKNSYPLPSNAVEVFTAPLNCFWSAICASGTDDLYITPGEGL